MRAIAITEKDNVATALGDIGIGDTVVVHQGEFETEVRTIDTVAFGHKFALRTIDVGEDIIKYGEVVGKATTKIELGEHVHVHNVESKRGRGDLVTKECV
jgi:altronate dehydratase small subunit